MKPLISTIMAVYNGEKFLTEAIESVLKQSLPSDEFIIVNNNSTDRTLEILKSYPKIKVLQQPIPGQFNALNMGVKAASGKYLNFIDADDVWHPDKNKLQIEFLENNPSIDMVFCYCEQFSTNPRDNSINYLPPQKCTIQLGLTIEREKFLQLGDLRTDIEAIFIYWFEHATSHGLSHRVLEDTLAYRRIHENNRSRNSSFGSNWTIVAREIIKQKKLRQTL